MAWARVGNNCMYTEVSHLTVIEMTQFNGASPLERKDIGLVQFSYSE